MENENSFIKSNNSQKVKIGQISDLEKEKSGKILNENVENLKVHKMPNSFKLGQFDSTIHPNDMGGENKGKADKIKKESSNKHKKTGMLIIVFGVIILLALGYFLYRYLFNNNESIFLTKNNNEITEVENNNVNEEENNEEDIQDPLVEEENNEEDIQDPLVEEENNEEDIQDPLVEEENNQEENLVSIVDSDNDGLNDLEEVILGTDPINEDTDGDTYLDSQEVLNFYNPTGSGLLDLSKTDLGVYENDLYKYSLIYPKTWEINELSDKSSVMFMNQSNEGFFQIATEPNIENISAKEWYLKQFGIEDLPDKQYFKDEKREFVFSEDGMYVYLTDSKKQRIFTISYSSLGMQPVYPVIFSVFINSFEFVD